MWTYQYCALDHWIIPKCTVHAVLHHHKWDLMGNCPINHTQKSEAFCRICPDEENQVVIQKLEKILKNDTKIFYRLGASWISVEFWKQSGVINATNSQKLSVKLLCWIFFRFFRIYLSEKMMCMEQCFTTLQEARDTLLT